jgi:hypothetical protein
MIKFYHFWFIFQTLPYGITNKGELEQHPIKKFIDVLKEDKEEKRDPRVPSRNSISA